MNTFSLLKDRRLLALLAGNFLVGTSMFVVGGLLSELSKAFDVSIAKAGWLIAAYALTCVIASPLLATFSSNIDRRKLLSTMLIICAVANGLAAAAQTYEQLFATRLIAAISSAVFTPQAAAVLGSLVGADKRTQATSLIMMGWAMAAVLGVPLGVWIGIEFGWRWAFGLISIASLVGAFGVWRAIPTVRVPPINLGSWLEVFKTPALLLVIAASTIYAAGNHAVFSYLAPLIEHLRPGQPDLLTMIFMTHGIAAVASNLLAVMLVEKIGLEKVVRIWGTIPILVMFAWPLLCHNLIALFVMQIFWALGSSAFSGLQQARLAMVAPVLVSASIALNSSAFYLGQSAGTMLGGYAWIRIDPVHLPWVGCGLVLVAMLISRKGRHAARKLKLASMPRASTL